MKRPRILLADDHPLVVAGLKSLLKAECEVVGVVGDERPLEATSRCKPEVIVTDISLPLIHQHRRQEEKVIPIKEIIALFGTCLAQRSLKGPS